jgi:hypothetical protein
MSEDPSRPVDPQFDPVTQLQLPSYGAESLSDEEARTMYVHGELRMRQVHAELAAAGVALEERARRMWGLRIALRTWTRRLMSNTPLAVWLADNERNPTFEQLVALNERRGLVGDDVYEAIIASSTQSRPKVNEELGIDPQNPPPLPPLR